MTVLYQHVSTRTSTLRFLPRCGEPVVAPVCWLLFAAAWTTSSIRLRVRWWLVTAERVPMMARVIRSSGWVCGCMTVVLVAVEWLRGGDGLMAMGAIMWTGEVG